MYMINRKVDIINVNIYNDLQIDYNKSQFGDSITFGILQFIE